MFCCISETRIFIVFVRSSGTVKSWCEASTVNSRSHWNCCLVSNNIHRVQEKSKLKCSGHIFKETWPILTKFGTQYSKQICHEVI